MEIVEINLDKDCSRNNSILAETKVLEDLNASYFEIEYNGTKHYFRIENINCSIKKPSLYVVKLVEQRMYKYLHNNDDVRKLLGKELTKIKDEKFIKEIERKIGWI